MAFIFGDCYAYDPTDYPITDGGHNLDSDDSCDFDYLPDTDPLLGPLQDNGGATETHALLVGSPAIDAVDDTECPETDQRGVPRPIDGDGDGEAVCDIGSFEYQPPVSPSLVTITGPLDGLVLQPYTFTAAVEPLSSTLPITYTWHVDGQTDITHTGDLTDAAAFTWDTPGVYTLTVYAVNIAGSVSDIHIITITAVVPSNDVYLPLVIKY